MKMKSRLITPQLEKEFLSYPLYSQDGRGKDAVCVCVFYVGKVRWYILEGQTEGEDFTMYAIVVGMMETEYGYVSLNELENVRLDARRFGLGMLEVDLMSDYKSIPLALIPDEELQQFLSFMERIS